MEAEQKIAPLDGVDIAYFDFPANIDKGGNAQGTVLLIHGFASRASVNWIGTSWVTTLVNAGYRVLALDNRGHGDSTKFYDPADYGPDIFAADAFALLDYLNIEACHVIGYSMGARITCWMAYAKPERVQTAIFGGMGEHIFGNRGGYEEIAAGLEANDPSTITDRGAAQFRRFADTTGSDRLALAACIRPSKVRITPDLVRGISTRVLVAVGSEDEIGGSPKILAESMPNAKSYVIEGHDHMKATGAADFKKAALLFLGHE